jgi:hypothetical protein
VKYFIEQRIRIIWERWEWETGATGFFFGSGWGKERQVATVRIHIGKKKSCNFVVNVVLRTVRMGN